MFAMSPPVLDSGFASHAAPWYSSKTNCVMGTYQNNYISYTVYIENKLGSVEPDQKFKDLRTIQII